MTNNFTAESILTRFVTKSRSDWEFLNSQSLLDFDLKVLIRTCLTLKAAKYVYNTLIEPILCYTDTVWGELSANPSKTLHQLQIRAAHIVLRRDSSKDTIIDVPGWVELETKRKRHKCTLVYKCLNNLVPKYLSDDFTRNYNVLSYNFYIIARIFEFI